MVMGQSPGALERAARRAGTIRQSFMLGTPSATKTLGQATPPRPPSPTPAAPPPPPTPGGGGPEPPMGPPPTQSRESLMLGGQPEPMTQPTPIAPSATLATAGQLPSQPQHSAATEFFMENGTLPTYFALQVMAATDEVSKELGRPANRIEVMERLQRRYMGETTDPGLI